MSADACPASAVQMVAAGPVTYPSAASLANGDLVVQVDVTVAPDGTVRAVRILHSSGASDADAAAIASAKASRYTPASQGCAAVEGHYTYRATFAAPVKNAPALPPPTHRLVY
jgi:TonB family protein